MEPCHCLALHFNIEYFVIFKCPILLVLGLKGEESLELLDQHDVDGLSEGGGDVDILFLTDVLVHLADSHLVGSLNSANIATVSSFVNRVSDQVVHIHILFHLLVVDHAGSHLVVQTAFQSWVVPKFAVLRVVLKWLQLSLLCVQGSWWRRIQTNLNEVCVSKKISKLIIDIIPDLCKRIDPDLSSVMHVESIFNVKTSFVDHAWIFVRVFFAI